jgi:hypothetical protein
MYCTILFFSELKVCDFEFDFVVYRFSAWNKTIRSCILRNSKLIIPKPNTRLVLVS